MMWCGFCCKVGPTQTHHSNRFKFISCRECGRVLADEPCTEEPTFFIGARDEEYSSDINYAESKKLFDKCISNYAESKKLFDKCLKLSLHSEESPLKKIIWEEVNKEYVKQESVAAMASKDFDADSEPKERELDAAMATTLAKTREVGLEQS